MADPIIIYGPTSTGKTKLALDIAKKINGEIISADSRQVYKSMDIGTGKITFNANIEKHHGHWVVDCIRIHGYDLVNPGTQFTVINFLNFTYSSMIQIIKLKKYPIIVGGTGFYIKALIDGISSIGITPDLELRVQLEKLLASDLYQKLFEISPECAQSMNQSDRANPRRLIRAIEIALSNKKLNNKYQKIDKKWKMGKGKYLIIGLTASNEFLYQKADESLEEQLGHGLVEEIKSLINSGVSPTWLESLGLEYRWITRYVKGEVGKEEALDRLKGDLHNFIRRQKTWFSKFPEIAVFDISKKDWEKGVEAKIVDYLK